MGTVAQIKRVRAFRIALEQLERLILEAEDEALMLRLGDVLEYRASLYSQHLDAIVSNLRESFEEDEGDEGPRDLDPAVEHACRMLIDERWG